MTDFLQELELELVRAARRRSAARASRSSRLRRWTDRRLVDLRDVASGGLAVASVGVVVIVLAFILAPRAQRTAAQQGGARQGAARAGGASSAGAAHSVSDAPPCARIDARRGGTWTAAGTAPGEGLRSLLDAAAPVTARARTAALRHLDQTVAQATTVYVDDIRAVRLPAGPRITLIPAQACATLGMPAGKSEWPRPQASLLAEVESGHGVATISLGTVAQIRSGDAYRSQTLLVRSARGLSSVAMVPPDVVRVVCHLARRGVRRFPVVDHLAVTPAAAASGTCHLV